MIHSARFGLRLLPAVALLLIGACVPVLNDGTPTGGRPTGTATPPQESAAADATVEPASATLTATAVTTGVVAPAVNSGLLLTTPLTMNVTGPISPDHSIVGPVGGPVMHGTPVGDPTTDEDDE